MTDLEKAARMALEALEYYQHRKIEWDYSDDAAITALRQALEQPQDEWLTGCPECGMDGECGCDKQPAQQEPVACRDEMCACRGGPCASCFDGEREKELADMRGSRDFYKRRTDELQKTQSQMRDPERTMVCDILANGRLLVPAAGRYNTFPQPAQQQEWRGPVDWEAVAADYAMTIAMMKAERNPWVSLTDDDLDDIATAAKRGNLYDLRLAIEAKLKEKNA